MKKSKALMIGLGLTVSALGLTACVDENKIDDETVSQQIPDESEETTESLITPERGDDFHCLYGCPMSSSTLANISDAEKFNEDDSVTLIV